MLNRVVLMGRLTHDPDIRYTPAGVPVSTITLAVERNYAPQGGQRETDFFDVVCWRQTAEFVKSYFTKGQLIAVEGRIQTRKWKDKHDQNRVTCEIQADSVYFAEAKKDSNPRAGYDRAVSTARSAGAPASPPPYHEPGDVYPDNYADYLPEDDGDVPF